MMPRRTLSDVRRERKSIPQRKVEGCEVEFKNTKHGRKVRVSPGCTKEQIDMIQTTQKVKPEDVEVGDV